MANPFGSAGDQTQRSMARESTAVGVTPPPVWMHRVDHGRLVTAHYDVNN
ncbi:hypothetical protein [Mycobacterium sp.]|nr:hypothetical protein [Mycobacterium sp.]